MNTAQAVRNMRRVPVLYLDLDGTVRKGFDELGRFVNKAEDVELFPRMAERLLSYRQRGWRIVGVTNQGGIATGMCSFEDAAEELAQIPQSNFRTLKQLSTAVRREYKCSQRSERHGAQVSVWAARRLESSLRKRGTLAMRS